MMIVFHRWTKTDRHCSKVKENGLVVVLMITSAMSLLAAAIINYRCAIQVYIDISISININLSINININVSISININISISKSIKINIRSNNSACTVDLMCVWVYFLSP